MPSDRLPATSGIVKVGVRPEKLHIRHPSEGVPPAQNGIEATVIMSTYIGVSTAHVCRASDGSEIDVYVQNLGSAVPAVAAGEQVWLCWDPDHTFAVPAAMTDEEAT
jgi:spermidine/putrescine transport system ATP-binding protein